MVEIWRETRTVRQWLWRVQCLLLTATLLIVNAIPQVFADPPLKVGLVSVASGLDSPVAVTHAGDGSERLFVVLQPGQIVIYDGNVVLSNPFLNIGPLVKSGGEGGLLSVAFHPSYESNGFFFVNYIDVDGNTVVSRYRVSADPNVADPESAELILQIDQPFSNHNGGQIQFGPDAFLYIGTGDGGSSGDPGNRAQDRQDLLGKILRIDVDKDLPYRIPLNNPFVNDPAARNEIWALGLRNPWRFSFDRLTGDLFIGDVGENEIEEIDFQPAGSGGGENYGWRLMEGSACFEPPVGCNDGSLVLPVLEYDHTEGCSVTGGFRYRGETTPALIGTYVFGDFCSGKIWGGLQSDGVWRRVELAATSLAISSFGEDEAGEIYVLDLTGGALYRLSSIPTCEVELDNSSYTDGDVVTASSLRFYNSGDAPVSAEIKLWLGTPGDDSFSVANFGAEGGFVLQPGEEITVGSLAILPVSAELPRGGYEINCRMLDPITGALLAENRNPFEVD